MGVSGRQHLRQAGTLLQAATWVCILVLHRAQTTAPAPGPAKIFSSDPGPGQAAGLQGSGGSSLVKLVSLQSLDQTVSDQQGIYSLTNLGSVDYIVSSVPLSVREYSSAKEPLAQIPFLFSPLAIIYTYPGATNVTLNLDANVLSQIFTCSITNYNNASIKALNPGLDLPARQFRPVAGSFDDSNTRILSNFVWGVDTWSPQCVSVTQTASTADWLNPLSQVSLVAGRIGFVPYASVVAANTPEYTQQLADLSVGAIRNPNGTFVAPSASAPFPFASSALPRSIVSSQWANLNASASTLPKAYAIGQLAYFITTANLGANGVAKGDAMRGTLQALLSDSYQGSLADRGGVPLPQDVLVNLRQQVQTLQNVAPPPSPGGGSGTALKIGLGVGIPCAVAAAVAGVLIWWCYLRRRKTSALSTTASAKVHRDLAAKEGNLLSTEDIVFDKDERGKRLLLGEGAFAKVFKAQWNGAEAAVKILHDQGEKQKTEFLHEATMLKSLRHPNVVDYFGLAFSEKDEMMLVMEFVGGGNLAKNLSQDKAEPRKLGWYRNGRFVLLGVARGLAFIHSRNVIVFDIKAGNVMMDQDGVTAKITDVGLSKVLAGSNTATLLRGTLAYMSPELFGAYSTTTDGPVKAPVTQAVDVYSFGVLMWEVLTGEKPSRTSSLRKIKVPEECPPEVEALRRRCMSRDPKDRPTATELMNELDALARMKSSSGTALPAPAQLEPRQDPKVPPPPEQPPRKGQHLARLSSGLARLASVGRDQAQALGRRSATPCADSGAKPLGMVTSGKEGTPQEQVLPPV